MDALRYKGTHGEVLPSTNAADWLRIEHVLQRFRDVWVPVETWPFLAIDVARVEAHRVKVREFAVFTNGHLMQNIRPDEGAKRLLFALMGAGVDAGMSSDAQVIVEGMANPQACWMMYFNDPLVIGMHPFAALATRYIYIDQKGSYQRTFGELVAVNKYTRPRSPYVDCNPLADMAHAFHMEYINGPRDAPRNLGRLAALLDAMFLENEKVLNEATAHHRSMASEEKPFDYMAPTLTRYGRLTHDASRSPRIELAFSLLHYEKALREFDSLKKAMQEHDTERAFFHGVYCVVAIAACIEAIANKLVFQQKGVHPDRSDKRRPLTKLNDAGAAIAGDQVFNPLIAGHPAYDALDKVRDLRDSFMHAKERDEEVDQAALTSVAFTAVDEAHCRTYLQQLRLGVAHVYNQLSNLAPPIVIRENVKWLSDMEVP